LSAFTGLQVLALCRPLEVSAGTLGSS
jgi:hypothetical protein